MCGHATLACAYVILRFYEKDKNTVSFQTLSGELIVKKNGDLYEMEFPAYELTKVPVTQAMTEAIGSEPKEAYMGRDLLCVFDDEETVRNANPNQEKVEKLDGLLLHLTAQCREFDSISRSFAPKCGVTEDPVCGSGHCHIVPYWADRLRKNEITAYQASARGGVLNCRLEGSKVILGGRAALFSVSEILYDEQK